MEDIQSRLFALQDAPYRAFTAKLIPNIDPDTIIGVRTPEVRRLAKELNGTEQARAFLAALPHRYFEENNLHGFLIERIRDFDACVFELGRFLPYVNNWSTCDQMRPVSFKKHLDALYPLIEKWIGTEQTYTVRFGVEMLMSFYLNERFSPEHLTMLTKIRSKEYYVRMMVAWYFATALFKQYDAALPVFEHRLLPEWTHNKAIQKAVESYRVTDEHKAALRALKI